MTSNEKYLEKEMGTLAMKQYQPVTADLNLFKGATRSKDGVFDVGNSGDDGSAACVLRASQILFRNAARAEHVSVGEVLRGDVTDGQF